MASTSTTQRLEERLRKYCLTPFGKDKGPRGTMILDELSAAGLEPKFDEKGNIFVVKNPSSKTSVLISSHMDTVFGTNPEDYGYGETGNGKIMGCFDNAVGCAINMELALNTSPRIKTYHVFTTGEETGGEGAEYLISNLVKAKEGEEKIREDPLCITLDVTGENFGEPFNIENIYPLLSVGRINELVKRHYGEKPTLSPNGVFDESMIYGKHARAFSVCPVVSGMMHSESCKMDRKNMPAAYFFLEDLLDSKNLEESVQLVRSSNGFVRKLAEEAKKLTIARGHIPAKTVYYSYGGREWSTYFVIPHSQGIDETIFDSSEDFAGQMRKYNEGEKIRDELDVSFGEFTFEAKPVLKEHRYMGMAYEYKVSLRPPGRLRKVLDKMKDSYKERADKASSWHYETELEFSTKGKDPLAVTQDTLSSVLASYESLTGGEE